LTLTVLRYAQKTYFKDFPFGANDFLIEILALPKFQSKNRSLLKVFLAAKGGI
jgi:hypothetical protein